LASQNLRAISRTFLVATNGKPAYMSRMSSKNLTSQMLQRWPLIALVTSVAMLGAAHAFERFGNMPPCALCLHQREAYWAAIAVGGLALIANRFDSDVFGKRAFSLLLVFAFGAGAIVAGFHVGVEYKWWPGIAECAASGDLKASGDLLGALSKPMDVPACDVVAWSMLGLSMAGWNMLISSGLSLASMLAIFYPTGLPEILEGNPS
jgi:disulfide bond formation protein DsbB